MPGMHKELKPHSQRTPKMDLVSEQGVQISKNKNGSRKSFKKKVHHPLQLGRGKSKQL